MRTRFCESDFWGKARQKVGQGFRKTSANVFLNSARLISPAGGVWGGMRAGYVIFTVRDYVFAKFEGLPHNLTYGRKIK